MQHDSRIREAYIKNGYLSDDVYRAVEPIRVVVSDFFDLAQDVASTMHQISLAATEEVKGPRIKDAKVRATFALLRCVGLTQGSLIMLQRGMNVEGRILTRGVFEVAFFLAALLKDPETVEADLTSDDGAARKAQAATLKARNFFDDDKETAQAVEQTWADLKAAGHKRFDMSKLSALGPLNKEYLVYQILSSDAVHISAASLARHAQVLEDRSAWTGYRFGPTEDPVVLVDTLLHLIGISIAVVLGYTTIVHFTVDAPRVNNLIDRYKTLRGE